MFSGTVHNQHLNFAEKEKTVGILLQAKEGLPAIFMLRSSMVELCRIDEEAYSRTRISNYKRKIC
jgi:hypothetical protein